MINRLDSICQAVLKGKWPGTRRAYEPGSTVASFYTTKLLDNHQVSAGSQAASSLPAEDPAASPQGSKVTKHVADKEFSVKINNVCSSQPPYSPHTPPPTHFTTIPTPPSSLSLRFPKPFPSGPDC